MAPFILVILAAVIVLTIFLLKRKTQETNEASSIKLQVNQLYDFPNTYGGDSGEIFEEKNLVTNPAYGLARHPTFTQPQEASSIKLQVNKLYDFPNTYGGDIEESFEEKSLVTNPAYGLARHPTFTQPQTDSLLATESNAHQPHTDNGPESPVLLANSTWHNGAVSAAAPIYETI